MASTRQQEKEARREARIAEEERSADTVRDMTEISVNGVAAVINDLSVEIGEWSEGKGFRDDWLDADKLEHYADMLEGMDAGHIVVAEIPVEGQTIKQVGLGEDLRRIANVLRTNVLGMKLALMHSELSEALETLRDHGASGILAGKGNFGEELADAGIRQMDTAHMIHSPIGDETIRKVDKNVHRPHKHGRVV